MPHKLIPEPWLAFLSALDKNVNQPTDLHCLGGFVVTMLYGLARSTSDIDVLMFVPKIESVELMNSGQKGSPLHAIHKIYLDSVTIVTPPDDYDRRLTEMFPQTFKNIRLLALDPYDIALTKLERNSPKDREDFKYLAETVPFDMNVLSERYRKELRPYLFVPEREDLTLKLWIEIIEEQRNLK